MDALSYRLDHEMISSYCVYTYEDINDELENYIINVLYDIILSNCLNIRNLDICNYGITKSITTNIYFKAVKNLSKYFLFLSSFKCNVNYYYIVRIAFFYNCLEIGKNFTILRRNRNGTTPNNDSNNQ